MRINKLKNISKVIYALIFSITLCGYPTVYANTIQPKTQKTDYSNNLGALTPTIVRQAVNGYLYAAKQNSNVDTSVLTIVDFTQPSYKKRLWVIDLKTGKVLLAMHVAQGKNTGKVYGKHFSNQPRSLESSPGVFITDGEYFGEHGKSMRVDGLEQGINSNALQRAVVIHSAWYMTPSFIIKNGYAGRSWGCFAVNPQRLPALLSTIHHHSVLFAYATSEDKDVNVNHSLSSAGEKIYQTIENSIGNNNSNQPDTTTVATVTPAALIKTAATTDITTDANGFLAGLKNKVEKL